MEIEEIIQVLREQLDYEKLCKQLIQPDISQYEVGRIKGQLELLSRVEILVKPNRENIVQEEDNETKRKIGTENRVSM